MLIILKWSFLLYSHIELPDSENTTTILRSFLEPCVVKAEKKSSETFWMRMVQICITNQTASQNGSSSGRNLIVSKTTLKHLLYIHAKIL